MTIERHSGRQQLVCDTCDCCQRGSFATEDFDIMLEDARREGWIATRTKEGWQHTCPACKGSQKQQRQLI